WSLPGGRRPLRSLRRRVGLKAPATRARMDFGLSEEERIDPLDGARRRPRRRLLYEHEQRRSRYEPSSCKARIARAALLLPFGRPADRHLPAGAVELVGTDAQHELRAKECADRVIAKPQGATLGRAFDGEVFLVRFGDAANRRAGCPDDFHTEPDLRRAKC